jgi:hypothetical protein
VVFADMPSALKNAMTRYFLLRHMSLYSSVILKKQSLPLN